MLSHVDCIFLHCLLYYHIIIPGNQNSSVLKTFEENFQEPKARHFLVHLRDTARTVIKNMPWAQIISLFLPYRFRHIDELNSVFGFVMNSNFAKKNCYLLSWGTLNLLFKSNYLIGTTK